MRLLGEARWLNARKLHTAHINKFRGQTNFEDQMAAEVEGFKGEWAVADSLGVPREINVSGRSDGRYDIKVGAKTVEVRCTSYQRGRIMCPESRPLVADFIVLVVADPWPQLVKIVGGVDRPSFLAGPVGDFGYGPTKFLGQDELEDWADLKDAIRP